MSPIAATQTTFSFFGSITIFAMCWLSGSPTFTQLLPESVLL